MYKPLYLFFLLLLSFAISFGQNKQDEQLANSIDSLVLQQVKLNEPGLAILITKKGKIVYEKAFGSANLELGVPLQPDMIFEIGSITKQFTAIAILQLMEQGKISLHDSVQQYIKDFPFKGYTITIENLLTHTSGIKDFFTIDYSGQNVLRWDFTPQQIIDHFKNAPLEFKPGSKYNYTNSGYTLLGRIIEVASGKSYYNYLLENVIKKAGLKNTFFATADTLIPKRVSSYTRDRGFYDNFGYMSMSFGYGCGDLLSTTEDLFKWNSALLNGNIVKKETLEKAFTPYKLSGGTYTTYGYGWIIDTVAGVKRIHHLGQFMGFVSTEKYFPAEDVFVVTLANVKSPEDTTGFSDKRYRLYENISLSAIDKKPVASVSIAQNILDGFIGVYKAAFQKKRTFAIIKKDGQLFADFGPGNVFLLMPQSDIKFSLPDVVYKGFPTTGTFFKTNGIVTKLIITQDKDYEWIRIK
jgi:CubicO group peptidase (beta-lactamase class C family)